MVPEIDRGATVRPVARDPDRQLSEGLLVPGAYLVLAIVVLVAVAVAIALWSGSEAGLKAWRAL